jgi:hypothetical protein
MATDIRKDRRTTDRILFLMVAIGVPLIVLAGFGRTYYLKGLFGNPPLPSLLVHLHGLVMSSWVILFGAQVWLVEAKRTRIHMRLGILGLFLAAAMVVVGIATALSAAARGGGPTGLPPLRFLVIPLGDILLFAVLVGLGLYYRRRLEVHKRLMLLVAVNLLGAAVARIPLDFIETGGPLVFFGLVDLFILACVVFDTIRNRRVHPAFLWGTLAIIAFQPFRIFLAATDVWLHFATWLVGLVG